MNPFTNNIPVSNLKHWGYQLNVSNGQLTPVYVVPIDNYLSFNNAMTSSNNLLQSVPHSNIAPTTSTFHRKGDCENVAMSNFPSQTVKSSVQRECENTTMSNTLVQTTEEPNFIIGRAFSLADDHEVSHDLQTKDVSKTVSSDGSKLSSVIDSTSSVSSEQLETQTMNASFAAVQSSKVPQPSLEPQICIGSVFSLADERAEDTDRNTTPATRSSVNRRATDQVCEVQPSAVDQENQTVDSQVVQNMPAIDTCPVEYLSATSTSDNQPTVFSDISKVIKQYISSQSSLNNISTSRRDLLSKSTNHQADLASPEQCSEDYSISTTSHSEISPSGSAVSIQSCSVNLEEASGTLGSSHDQPNTDQIRSKSETEGSTILPICDDNKSVSHQDQMIQSHAATPEVGEVVDLDTEDVDDCLLVKIDLSKHFVPFGLQIHNTEVVIHDSDTDDESVIEQASEVKEQDLSSKTVSSGDSASLSSKDVGDKCKSPERDVCSNVVISEIDSCELIGSLSMEVDEINSDTDTPLRNLMNLSPEPYDCSAEETITTSTDVHQSITISSIDSNDAADKIKSERKNVTVVVPQNSSSLNSNIPDCELELHVEDDTLCSKRKGNKKLKVILPSKFSQDNLPKPNRMANNKTNSSNAHISVTDISSSDPTMKNKPVPQNHGFKNILRQNKSPKSPNKQLEQKAIKKTTRPSKQSSSAKSSMVASNQNISSGETSAVQTEVAPKSSSIMCKICFMPFSSRMELVTHTWNTHRHPFNLNFKCEVCDKSFPNSSLLKLHQKVNCSTLGTNANEKRVLPETGESVLHGLLRLKNTDNSSVFQPYNSVSRMKIGSFDRKNTHLFHASDHNQPERNEDPQKDITSLTNMESQVRSSDKAPSKTLVELDEPPPSHIISCVEETEDGDFEPNTSTTAAVTLHSSTSLLESGHRNSNEEIMHECSNCQKMFSNQPQLKKHEILCDVSKMRKNASFKCLICGLVLTEYSHISHHMLNSPKCAQEFNTYCYLCNNIFKSPADKQAHLSLSLRCWLNEVQLLETMVRGNNLGGFNNQNVGKIKDASVTQKATTLQFNANPQNETAAVKSHAKNEQVKAVKIHAHPKNEQAAAVQFNANSQNETAAVKSHAHDKNEHVKAVKIHAHPQNEQPAAVKFLAHPQNEQPAAVKFLAHPQNEQPAAVKFHAYPQNEQPAAVKFHAHPQNEQAAAVKFNAYSQNEQAAAVKFHAYSQSEQAAAVKFHAYSQNEQAAAVKFHAYSQNEQVAAVKFLAYPQNEQAAAVKFHAYSQNEQAAAVKFHAHPQNEQAAAVKFHAHPQNEQAAAVKFHAHPQNEQAAAVKLHSHSQNEQAAAVKLHSHSQNEQATAIQLHSHSQNEQAAAIKLHSHSQNEQAAAVKLHSHSQNEQAAAVKLHSHPQNEQAAAVKLHSHPQNEQAAAVKLHSHPQNEQIVALNTQVPPQDKQVSAPQKKQSKIVCSACKENFETKKLFKLHLNVSKNCKKEAKQIMKDAKSLDVLKKQQSPIQQDNRQMKVSKVETLAEILSEEKIIQCMICKTRFSSEGELVKHYMNKKKCSAHNNLRNNLPGSKTLNISPNPVSVICKVCHLSFTDDFKLAEHHQLNPSCHHSEKVHGVIELSSVNNETVKKYVKKIRSCKIATGISSSTRVITILCASEDDISMLQHPLEELNCKEKESKNVAILPNSDVQNLNCASEERLPLTLKQAGLTTEVGKWKEFNNDYLDLFKSNSTGLTMQAYRDNDGCRDGTEENMSDFSDCDSDIEEDSSANEESDVEYRCKLCSKTFHIRSQFVRHTKLHHPSSKRRSVHCKVCTRKFHDLTDLQAHLLQFQYCFIPLTRKLWESKQDPHLCTMCRKSLQSPKDLRKHCFKNMPCRLRYVNLVINNIKTKDSSKSLGLFSSESSETEVPSVKTPKIILKNNEDNSEVSSSVQDCDNPQNVNLPPNVGFNSAIPTPETLATSKKECLNCGKVFTDFLEHIFTHQACLNFYGIYKNRCPVSLPFCFQCKQRFDNITMLTKHACKGFVPYTNTCTVCELKFTSMMDLNAHMKTCQKAPVLRSQAKNCFNEKKTVAANPNSTRQHSQHVSVPVASTSKTNVSVPVPGTSKTNVSVPAASTSKTIHSTEELFPCRICDAKFPLLRLLLEHSYQHEEETPLTCDRCDSVFVHYNQFVSHQTFHIRMDKENGILSAKAQYNEMPPVLEKLDSSDTSNNQKGHNMSDHLSACLFCHQEFPNAVAKVDHISNTPACLGIMKYIIENKFFTKEPSDNLFDEVKTADPNCCEFCKHNFSDKLFHYLQSTCIYRLEKAILRFRAVSCPPESVVTTTAANKTANVGISSTTNNKSPLLKEHTFYCPICNQSFHDQNNLLIHQREQHGQLSDRKLPPEDPIINTVDRSDTLLCFTCNKYLRTIAEIENHKLFPCKKVTVLPINIAVRADMEQLMCTICNTKFSIKRTLIEHMIYKHCDENANELMIAAGQKTSQCSICSKDVLLLKWRTHFQQHRSTYLQEIKTIPDSKKVICFVCKRHIVRSCILEHINKHSIASIFTVDSKGGTNIASKRTSSEDAQKEIKQKKQKLETALNKTSNIFSAVRCKLCDKILQNCKTFRSHFKKSHVEYHPQNWRIWFSLVDPLEHTQSFVGINGSVSSIESKFENANSNTKSFEEKTKSNTDCSKIEPSRDDKKSSFAKKIAQLRPIGSCKICQRSFINFPMFKFHLRTLHNRYSLEDEKKFFQQIVPLKKNESTDSHSFMLNPGQASFYRMVDFDVQSDNLNHLAERKSSSPDSLHSTIYTSDTSDDDDLDRVCFICRASFSDASLYRAHLETHITPCKIVLNDCFDEESTDEESEEMKDIQIIENFLDDDVEVKIEYDY